MRTSECSRSASPTYYNEAIISSVIRNYKTAYNCESPRITRRRLMMWTAKPTERVHTIFFSCSRIRICARFPDRAHQPQWDRFNALWLTKSFDVSHVNFTRTLHFFYCVGIWCTYDFIRQQKHRKIYSLSASLFCVTNKMRTKKKRARRIVINLDEHQKVHERRKGREREEFRTGCMMTRNEMHREIWRSCTAFCSRLHEHLRWVEELIRPCTQIAFLCMRSGCGRETKLKFRVECLVGGFLHHHMNMLAMHPRPAVAKWNGREEKKHKQTEKRNQTQYPDSYFA